MSVRQVAAQTGVSAAAVWAATKPQGPYPRQAAATPQRGEQWAQQRAAGESVARIAHSEQVGVSIVSTATRGFGPFPPASPGGAGTLSLRGVSRVAGLSLPALRRRIDQGELPAPAGHRPGGWPYWDAGDIQRWLEESPLRRCPICQARLKRLDVHLLRRHGAGTSPS